MNVLASKWRVPFRWFKRNYMLPYKVANLLNQTDRRWERGWDHMVDSLSDRWDQNMAESDKVFVGNYLKKVATNSDINSILEIGAGAGHWTRLIEEKVRQSRYLNLDVSSEFCQRFQQTFPGLGIMNASAADASFAENSFDLVILIDVLRHNNYFRELLERVAPWGKSIFVADWFGRESGSGRYTIDREYGFNFMSVDELVDVLKGKGFNTEVVSVPVKDTKKFILWAQRSTVDPPQGSRNPAGKPVVATRVSGIPKVVADSVEGFLVEPLNPQHLAARILTQPGNSELQEFFTRNTMAKALGNGVHRVNSTLLQTLPRTFPLAAYVAPRRGSL